jgi:protein-tyrosine phosphatase
VKARFLLGSAIEHSNIENTVLNRNNRLVDTSTKKREHILSLFVLHKIRQELFDAKKMPQNTDAINQLHAL